MLRGKKSIFTRALPMYMLGGLATVKAIPNSIFTDQMVYSEDAGNIVQVVESVIDGTINLTDNMTAETTDLIGWLDTVWVGKSL